MRSRRSSSRRRTRANRHHTRGAPTSSENSASVNAAASNDRPLDASLLEDAFKHPDTIFYCPDTERSSTLVAPARQVGTRSVVITAVTGTDGKPYAIGFEMRLPANWNGGYVDQVNGGNDGAGQILSSQIPEQKGDRAFREQ